MNELDVNWHEYARLQLQINRRRRVDATGWGVEAGLDHLLAQRGQGPQPTGAATAAIERGKSRERHRARLRGWYFDPQQVDDPTDQLHDRIRLHRLIAGVGGDDWTMLLATGLGYDSTAVAALVLRKADAIRQRIARLRSKLAAC